MPVVERVPGQKVCRTTESTSLDIVGNDVPVTYERLRQGSRQGVFCRVFGVSAVATLRFRGTAHAVVEVLGAAAS